MIVAIALVLGGILLTTLLVSLLDWRGLFRRIRVRLFAAIFGAWYVGALGFGFFAPRGHELAANALPALARLIPLSTPALAIAAAAVLTALYAAVEKLFREPDFVDTPKERARDTF